MTGMAIANPFFEHAEEGAVDLDECTSLRGCTCKPVCLICGFGKHSAVHGPVAGKPPGSAPWGHRFQSEPRAAAEVVIAKLTDDDVNGYKGVDWSDAQRVLSEESFAKLRGDVVRNKGPDERHVYPWNVVDYLAEEYE